MLLDMADLDDELSEIEEAASYGPPRPYVNQQVRRTDGSYILRGKSVPTATAPQKLQAMQLLYEDLHAPTEDLDS